MTATVKDVKTLSLSGEFNGLSDAQIQKALDDAAATLAESQWDTLFDQAHENLAAHLLVLRMGGGGNAAAGPTTSEKADGLSIGFAASPALLSHGSLATTMYGQEYLRLLRTLALTPVTVNTTHGSDYVA